MRQITSQKQVAGDPEQSPAEQQSVKPAAAHEPAVSVKIVGKMSDKLASVAQMYTALDIMISHKRQCLVVTVATAVHKDVIACYVDSVSIW